MTTKPLHARQIVNDSRGRVTTTLSPQHLITKISFVCGTRKTNKHSKMNKHATKEKKKKEKQKNLKQTGKSVHVKYLNKSKRKTTS